MEQAFYDYLKKRKYAENTIHYYIYWVKRVIEREKLTNWWFLAAKINMICVKYDRGGEEAEFGEKGKLACINGLKRFKEYLNSIPSEFRDIINQLN